MIILFQWTLFRLVTSVFATLISYNYPLTDLEKAIHLVPIKFLDSYWLERAWLSPWLRWDAVWYQRIVENGYNAINGTAQFHPLYSAAASILHALGLHPLLALLMVSSASSLAFLFVYNRLAQIDLTGMDAHFSMLMMLLAPAAFVLFAPYSEALFLLCAACTFYWARRRRWWLAALAGGLATLTRQQGLLLLLPIAYEMWEESAHSWKRVCAGFYKYLSIGVFPLCYALWIGYRSIFIGDTYFTFRSVKQFIYSWLISPSAIEVVPQQSFTWPWRAIWLALQKLILQPDIDIWVNCILAIVFLFMLGLAWKNMNPTYRIYAILVVLVSFSYYTGPIHPYMGLPRHLLLAFPVFIYSAPVINRPILRPIVLTLLGIGYFLQLFLYCLEAWVA